MARIEREWQAEHEGAALATEVHRILVVSHRQAKGFIDGRCVTVNGAVAESYGVRLKAGDTVKVAFDPDRTYEVMPPAKKLQSGPFETLWEDTHLLFVHKPAGLLTVPAEQGGEPSLAEAITESYRRRGFKRFQLYIVHRLDRFTSGVLVFAKTPEALHGLKKLFELHKLQRVYRAVLVGELPENSGTLAGHLIEHAKSLKMSVAKERKGAGGKRMPPGAKEAVTHYRVVERLPGHTVVEVKLETGRRNQIRVQFADRGFPLLGDQVYGTESPMLDRQALHAELLGFRHPVTDEQVTVSAPMPADMEAALKVLRTQSRLTRASEGLRGEEGIFKPKITRERKLDRSARARRFEGAGEAERPARPRREGPADRPRREGAEERPRRTFDRDDRPARPRREGPADRPRREGAEDRPRRTFDRDDRPARPRREGPADRPHREGTEDRPRCTFDRDDRPARPRREGPADRPRREGAEERPRRTFDRDDRPARPRREGPADRPRREGAEERPRRTFDRDDRPARPRREGPADRPRREGAEERPRRTFDRDDRPARPRREGAEDRPRRTSKPGDRPTGPRREGSNDRPRRASAQAPGKKAPFRPAKPKSRKS
ncbi:MAG TPA: RluA family pseudouridine synthase [Holophagaceae bacterium]